MLDGAFEQEGAGKKRGVGWIRGGGGWGGRAFKRFRCSLCVILRSCVLRIYVGACYTRGARSRRSCVEEFITLVDFDCRWGV